MELSKLGRGAARVERAVSNGTVTLRIVIIEWQEIDELPSLDRIRLILVDE